MSFWDSLIVDEIIYKISQSLCNKNLMKYCILSSIVRTFFIKNDAEILPAHCTWKVAEIEMKIKSLMRCSERLAGWKDVPKGLQVHDKEWSCWYDNSFDNHSGKMDLTTLASWCLHQQTIQTINLASVAQLYDESYCLVLPQ